MICQESVRSASNNSCQVCPCNQFSLTPNNQIKRMPTQKLGMDTNRIEVDTIAVSARRFWRQAATNGAAASRSPASSERLISVTSPNSCAYAAGVSRSSSMCRRNSSSTAAAGSTAGTSATLRASASRRSREFSAAVMVAGVTSTGER